MGLLADLADLILPACCVCCASPGSVWCAGCQPPSGGERVACAIGPPTFAAGEYADALRAALLSYKERGQRRLVAQLAGYFSDAADSAVRASTSGGSELAGLVPVPSSRAAARARGGDHLLRLAHAVGRQLGLPVLDTLQLHGPVADSAGLSARQRRQNLAGRLTAAPPARSGRPAASQVILLDDIVTTGATLSEASRALVVAGWDVPAAAVIAATRLRNRAVARAA
jgi:predicted amidophosphoribosyltransferase